MKGHANAHTHVQTVDRAEAQSGSHQDARPGWVRPVAVHRARSPAQAESEPGRGHADADERLHDLDAHGAEGERPHLAAQGDVSVAGLNAAFSPEDSVAREPAANAEVEAVVIDPVPGRHDARGGVLRRAFGRGTDGRPRLVQADEHVGMHGTRLNDATDDALAVPSESDPIADTHAVVARELNADTDAVDRLDRAAERDIAMIAPSRDGGLGLVDEGD